MTKAYQKPTHLSTEPTRCAFYMRVSTEHQASEGYSLEAQQVGLRTYAKMRNWTVWDEYIDGGFSGGTDQRPEFQRLMHDARSGYFSTVVVVKLDRFMRNQRHLLNTLHELQNIGVSFISTGESLDTSTPQGEFALQMMGSVAELERKTTGERVRAVRRHLAAQGQWSSGRVLYGFRYNKEIKELEIYELEAISVRYIFIAYTSQKLGLVRLAEIMNREGFPTPRMGARKHTTWTQSLVRHILKHPAYMGGPSNKWKYRTPAIVTTELWEAAQRQLASNRHFKPSSNIVLKYRGKLRCGLCGRTLRAGCNHGARAVYDCPGRLKAYHLDGSPRCTLPRFPALKLDSELDRQLNDICNNPATFIKHLQHTLENLEAEKEALETRLKPLNAEAIRIREDMDILEAKLEMRRINPDEYKARMKGLKVKLSDVERRQNEADPMLLNELDYKTAQSSFCEVILKEINDLTPEGKQKARQTVLGIFIGLSTLFEKTSNTKDDRIFVKLLQQLTGEIIPTEPQEVLRRFDFIAEVHPESIMLKGNLPVGQTNVTSTSESAHHLSRA
ncbi:recombinase family protein [Chloroflexota bacterium]